MPRVNSDVFIYEEDKFEAGFEPTVIRLSGRDGYTTIYMQAKDKLAQLQQLRDLCQQGIDRLGAARAEQALIQAALDTARQKEEKDDPDLVPVLIPLVDEHTPF